MFSWGYPHMLGEGNMLTYLCFRNIPTKKVNEKGGGPDASKVTVLSNIKFVMSTSVTLGYPGIFYGASGQHC